MGARAMPDRKPERWESSAEVAPTAEVRDLAQSLVRFPPLGVSRIVIPKSPVSPPGAGLLFTYGRPSRPVMARKQSRW